MSDPHIAKLEAEHAALCAQIAPLDRQIAALREKRAPLIDARARVERVLSARRKLALMSPAERDALREQMGEMIGLAPIATSVRGS